MRDVKTFWKTWALAAICSGLGSAAVALADDGGDTASSAPAAFKAAVVQSQAVVIRVPINANGDEKTSAAEMRLLSQEVPSSNAAALESTWKDGLVVGKDAVTKSADPASDTSTCGWNNYGGYGGGGWYQPSYYYSYQPSYYNYGSSWSYSYSYSYTASYQSSSYPSYNYYYYPRDSYYDYDRGGRYRW